MRLLVDLTSCEDAASGAGRRALELWPRLVSLLGSNDRVAFVTSPSFGALIRARASRAELLPFPGRAGRPWSRFRHLNPRIRRWLRDDGFDVVHQETLPLASPPRTIFTLHDLREVHPRFRSARWRRVAASFLLQSQVSRCARILTVSEWMKAEIQGRRGLRNVPVDVVPNAVDREYFRTGGRGWEALSEWSLEAGAYLLHVGHREPRKNLPFLVEVLKELVERGRDLRLVLVGRRKGRYAVPEKRARKLGMEDRLVLLDDVTDDQLPPLYRGAHTVLVPSLYEGFGMTALEAVAAGAPVLAPRRGPFPEFLSDGQLVPPDAGAEAWADAVEEGRGASDPSAPLPDWDGAARALAEALFA